MFFDVGCFWMKEEMLVYFDKTETIETAIQDRIRKIFFFSTTAVVNKSGGDRVIRKNKNKKEGTIE